MQLDNQRYFRDKADCFSCIGGKFRPFKYVELNNGMAPCKYFADRPIKISKFEFLNPVNKEPFPVFRT